MNKICVNFIQKIYSNFVLAFQKILETFDKLMKLILTNFDTFLYNLYKYKLRMFKEISRKI